MRDFWHSLPIIIQHTTTLLDLAAAVSPPFIAAAATHAVGASRCILRHHCRHWTAATAFAVVGPPLGCCHATRPAAAAASKRCAQRPQPCRLPATWITPSGSVGEHSKVETAKNLPVNFSKLPQRQPQIPAKSVVDGQAKLRAKQ
jgi:hypothetical protein